MLPKFASHVFHHTQRAAQAAAQNHALRNVLGLQNQGATSASSSGPLSNWTNAASSGSSWGSAGGAKYNTGSRFYQGYTGAGRAVTQANSTSAHDNSNSRADDDDDLSLTRRSLVINSRHRPRSNSLHLTGTGRQKRAETFGVLRTVQLHQARSSHVLATATGADSIETKEERTDGVASPRVLVRRNSTAASNASDIESLEPLESLKPADEVSLQAASLEQAPVTAEEALSVDPSAPQTVLPPSEPSPEDARDNVGEKGNAEFARHLQVARAANDHARVVSEVLQFRSSGTRATVRDYNEALYALIVTRQGGQPITVILETYNDMLTRQIAPNVRTYKMMILALCERDREVERVCSQYEWRQKRRELSGRTHGNAYTMDQKNLELLREEDNFTSAMLVFQAAQTLFRDRDGRRLSLGPEVYSTLLCSCMIHANTDSAVRIWGAIESIRGYIPDATSYLHLLGTYTSAGDLDSAQDVFEEFLLAAKENRVSWPAPDRDDLQNHILSDDLRSGKARASQMLIWVKMIEAYFRAKQPVKALNLLEQMMDSPAPVAFGPTDVPLPCASVYSAFIRGFVENDDIQSALAWFNRMLEQDSVSRHPLIPSAKTPRPDQNAWNTIMEALIERGMLAEANKKFKQLTEVADVEGLTVRMFDRVNVFTLNVENLRVEGISSSEFEARVKFIKEHIIDPSYMDSTHPLGPLEYQNGTFADFFTVLCEHSKAKQALEILERHGKQCSAILNRIETDMDVDNDAIVLKRKGLHDLIRQVLPAMLYDNKSVSLDLMAKVDKLLDDTLCFPGSQYNFFLMKKYLSLKSQGELQQLGPRHWMMLSKAAVRLLSDEQFLKRSQAQGFGLDELKVYMKDAVYSDYDRRTTWHIPSPEVANLIMEAYGETEAYNIFSILGHQWTRFVTSRGASPASYGNRDLPTPIRIDREHSRRVDEYFPASPRCTPQQAWARYEEGLAKNVYPTPDVVGRLIATFGRLNDMEKVHRLYADGQRVLAAYENDKELQSVGWYAIEDQMIIGLAHAGQIEKAHVHRQRIIDQGGNPSPDAYSALIQCVRETTDDSANALALWHESQMRGVVANLYLYNTVISKLSRARKADFALELFQQMKANFVRPSSVTYGAVIAACCRVGDAQSAEVLFEEMTSQKNFKPRIPPYNTMIQFYTHIVRDRERALHYFGLLLASGIKPTAHTYKLLIDSYGTIEPTDLASMEDVFLQLTKDKRVQVQGVHWAALINAWGCVQKDLNRAISIFDSIASHPTTQRSGLVLPDAIVYESMINVLVTLRRTDLIPSYLERLSASGIHMTAYIANLLIKGYAIAGDLERAREVFEGLLDPPTGHAAPNNHVPHSSTAQVNVPSSAPVYREPSTWEAMVRAELGSGDRDRATALLQRVQERHFPPAVYARISGIMLDDSVSPWVSWSPTHNGNMESWSGSHSPQ